MPKIIKFIILIISELLFLVILLIVIPSIFIKEKSGIEQDSYSDTLSVDVNHIYIQSFIVDHNNLNSISIQLKNPELKNYDMVYIEIQNDKYETLRDLSISGRSIGDPSWINFKFPALNSKKGEKIFIKVTGDAIKDNHIYIFGDFDTKNINFRTTYRNITIKDSFFDSIKNLKNKFNSLNKYQLNFYLILLVLINIFLLITL